MLLICRSRTVISLSVSILILAWSAWFLSWFLNALEHNVLIQIIMGWIRYWVWFFTFNIFRAFLSSKPSSRSKWYFSDCTGWVMFLWDIRHSQITLLHFFDLFNKSLLIWRFFIIILIIIIFRWAEWLILAYILIFVIKFWKLTHRYFWNCVKYFISLRIFYFTFDFILYQYNCIYVFGFQAFEWYFSVYFLFQR